MIVLDASVVGPLAVPDERGALPDVAITALLTTPLVVPMHWHLEVANMIQMAQRRGRLDAALAARLFNGDLALDPDVDGFTARRAWRFTAPLAEKHRLTIYDAAYLELALRRGGMLATLDGALVRAARAEDIPVLDLA